MWLKEKGYIIILKLDSRLRGNDNMVNKNNRPLVSVIMPVYNAGKFLVEAIKSIRNQTYENWELLAVNDGSTDNSWPVLQKLAKKDKRIRLFDLKGNFGLGYAANFAINKSRGKFLARFDADDIMPKNRLKLQVNYLISHPEILAVGGQCVLINDKNQNLGKKIFPLTDNKIRKMAFSTMSLQAGSMMINRSKLPKNFKYYSVSHLYFEDHELLFKLLLLGNVANLSEILLYYRQHNENSTKKVKIKRVFFSILRLRIKAVLNGLAPDFKGVMINIVQLILISLLPEKMIERLYFFLRITLNKLFIIKEANKIKKNIYKYRLSLGY